MTEVRDVSAEEFIEEDGKMLVFRVAVRLFFA
jgi:hypothetical protein